MNDAGILFFTGPTQAYGVAYHAEQQAIEDAAIQLQLQNHINRLHNWNWGGNQLALGDIGDANMHMGDMQAPLKISIMLQYRPQCYVFMCSCVVYSCAWRLHTLTHINIVVNVDYCMLLCLHI